MLIEEIMMTPIAVPITDPTPPNSDVPPITTAATAASKSPAPNNPLPASRRELRIRPPMPAVKPLIIKAKSLMRPVLIPAKAADSASPPTA